MIGPAFVLAMAAGTADAQAANPCGDVFSRARRQADSEEAMRVLGACLASRAPHGLHLRVVAEMARHSEEAGDRPGYCRFSELLGAMLEHAGDGVADEELAEARAFRTESACRCDRLRMDEMPVVANDGFDRDPSEGWVSGSRIRVVHDVETAVDDVTYRLLVHQQRGMDRLCVFGQDSLLYSESRGAVSSGFLEASVFRSATADGPIAAVRWLQGVHGETLQFVDLERGRPVLEKSSTWPVHYSVDDGTIRYTLYGDRLPDGSFEEIQGEF